MSHITEFQTTAHLQNCEDTINILKRINDSDNQQMDTNSFEFNSGTSASEDSGLPLTSSFESSIDSYRISIGKLELFESDGEVSLLDSLENSPESGMNIENFNTLKKGPVIPIDPPPEFQDSPQTTLIRSNILEDYACQLSSNVILNAIPGCTPQNLNLVNKKKHTAECEEECCNEHLYSTDCNHLDNIYDEPSYYNNKNKPDKEIIPTKITANLHRNGKDFKISHDRKFSTLRKFNPSALSEIHDYDMYYGLKKTYNIDHYQHRKTLYSPLHHNGGNTSTSNRPLSRNSLNSRLSSSHNSLTVSNSNKPDDSIFITQAMSHDALLSREISDFYNVPVDSDIYASPIDMIRPDNKYYSQRDDIKNKHYRLRYLHFNKRKKKGNLLEDFNEVDKIETKSKMNRTENKRKSVPENTLEPLHLTLEEVKQFYQTLYSNTNGLHRNTYKKSFSMQDNEILKNNEKSNRATRSVQYFKNSSIIQSSKVKSLSPKNNLILHGKRENENNSNQLNIAKKSQFSMSLKQKFCSIFRFGRNHRFKTLTESAEFVTNRSPDHVNENKEKIQFRALPPLPTKVGSHSMDDQILGKTKKKTELNSSLHFASSIEKVKDYGWYWGPVSSEAAEKVLSNEPDGSFIVRDSSDDHYIFSLSFKLNNCVRHVRIEQDQGTFSFGSYAKFKSQTITEFIEKAVEHSRSGRYLFFLHRRPEHGPMRVQLTNPVSRFKHVQSLQHMCRFIILKMVIRKDLVQSLPLPRRLLDYLSYKHCYSEQIESDSSQSQISGDD